MTTGAIKKGSVTLGAATLGVARFGPIGDLSLEQLPDLVITSGDVSDLAENSGPNQTVYTVTSTRSGATYSIINPNSSAQNNLSINSTTGVITLTVDPDFETDPVYSFTVRATHGSDTADKILAFAIQNIDESPAFVGNYAINVNEDVIPGAILFSGSVTEGNEAGAITFALTDDANGRISIASTGDKTFNLLATGYGFNYEEETSYNITITATDAGNNTTTQAGTITIVDVDETPTLTSAATSVSYIQGIHPRTGPGGVGSLYGRIRQLSTASGERSAYSITGNRALGTWIVPDVDGEGADVYLTRVTQFGSTGTESAIVTQGDRTFTVDHKGDAATASTVTFPSGNSITGPSSPLPQIQYELGGSYAQTIPNVSGNVNIPYATSSAIRYSNNHYDNSADVNSKWDSVVSSLPQFYATTPASMSHNDTYTFNFVAFESQNLDTNSSTNGGELVDRSTDDAHSLGSIYTGPNATTPAGHSSSNSMNFTDDNFLLEEIPLIKTLYVEPNVNGQVITFTQNASNDLEDTFGRSLSGVNNPTINVYVGDTVRFYGSDRSNIAIKNKFLNSDDTSNQPTTSTSPKGQMSGSSDYFSLTPTEPGTFYYFNRDDWRGYGIIQAHSRDVQNPFSSGTPAGLLLWHTTMGQTPRVDSSDNAYSTSSALPVYVRNLYEHTLDETDAGRISFHKTEAGAKASAANVDRLDFTGVSGGQYSHASGIRIAPIYKMALPILVTDTQAPNITSSSAGNISAGPLNNYTTIYTATATDTGSGVSSYAITSNTSGISLSINSSTGAVVNTAATTINAGQTYQFTFSATDGAGNTSYRSVTLTGIQTSTTHTISKGTYQPPAAVTYWGAFVPKNTAYTTGNATVSPGSPAGPFGTGNEIREVSANYNGYTSGAGRHYFQFAVEGDYTNTNPGNSNPGTSVEFSIGGVSQTLTFASADSVVYLSGTGQLYTYFRWHQGSTEPAATTVWGRIKAAANNSTFTITVT
jgi:hypothetical protein